VRGQFFEVVLVQDLVHAASEASPLGGHLFLEGLSQILIRGFVENKGRHNVAPVGNLIHERILVGRVERLEVKHYHN
jgi:hypothetical protein